MTLRELALKATQGEWMNSGPSITTTPDLSSEEFCEVIATCNHHEILGAGQEERNKWLFEKNLNNAKFIAACNPKAVIALLDMVEQMGNALIMAKKSLKRAPFNTHRAMDDAIKAYDDFMKG